MQGLFAPPRLEPCVLYGDRQVLVVNKPSGWLSQPDETKDLCVTDWAVAWLAQGRSTYNPFVAPVHRLDRPVSGVLALARTSKAAARLTSQFANRGSCKTYLAVVQGSGTLPENAFEVRLYQVKNKSSNRVECSVVPTRGGQEAVTQGKVLARCGNLWLVQLHPVTGKPHQLRVAMSHLGFPVVGDLKYNSSLGLGHAIALHAQELKITHPTLHTPLVVSAPLPDWWHLLWPQLV